MRNYRNIKEASVKFSKPATFIVGENNLGKSNLLHFLADFFSKRSFEESDFNDVDCSISAEVKLRLSTFEIGLFYDIADPEDENQITIQGKIEDPESDIEFIHMPTGELIPANIIRRISFFLFDTLNSNSRTLSYGSNRGTGRVLTKGLIMYQENNGLSTIDFFDKEKLEGLIEYLNQTIENISLLSDYGIGVGIDSNERGLLGNVVTLTDSNNLHFSHASSGVQYVALTIMQILEAIIRIPKRALEKRIYVTPEKEKVIPAILAFDEPEVHLHPYMQRTLTKYLCNLAEGNDVGFNTLLQQYFGIDKMLAQIIIVTHSPSIISPNYSSIVRIGKNLLGSVSVISGCDIDLDRKLIKHFIAQFDSLKEAFFSRGALVVEGVSEAISLRGFARTLGIDLDAKGIIIISSDGKGSAPQICYILEKFEIPAYSIVDRDSGPVESGSRNNTTIEADFEAEIIEALFSADKQSVFISLLESNSQYGRNTILQESMLKKSSNKYHPDWFTHMTFSNMSFAGQRFDGNFADDHLTRLMMYAWLSKSKGAILGNEIGKVLPVECIPSCYVQAIQNIANEV